MEFRLIEHPSSIFYEASRKLTQALRSIQGTIPKREFYSGLLYLREDGLKYALSKSPGDIIEAFLANRYLKQGNYPRDIEPQMTERMANFKHLLIFRHYFDNVAKKIERGDVVILATRCGEENLSRIRNSPTSYVQEWVSRFGKIASDRDSEPPPAEDPMIRYSKQMIPVLNWCLKNNLPPSFDSLKLSINFYKNSIILNTADIAIGPIPVNAFSWDDLLKITLKYIYRFSEVRETVKKYANHMYKSGFIFSLESFPIKIQAHMMRETERWYLKSPLPDESVPWPLNFGNKSLWASSALIGLIVRGAKDVQTKRQKAGWSFEERIRVELLDRGFAILTKDKDSPAGEIDMLVRKGNSVWLLEAKDYGLWYENWYASSRLFNARKASLEASFAKFPNKIKWVDLNQENFNIKDQQIQGVIISAFLEDVELPEDILITTIEELDSIFGKSKYKTYHESVYDRAKQSERHLEREWSGIKGLKPKICPSHPACVFLALEEDKVDWSLLGDFCLRLQAMFGGGPCPVHNGFCMWTSFCGLGVDPCPVAGSRSVVH